MVDFRDSQILQVSVSKILPFIMMLSFYIFSYGANFPGGGFQSGVVFGTSIVVVEIGLGRKLFGNDFYKWTELIGVIILFGSMLYGYLQTGYFLGGLYRYETDTLLLSNVYYWVLNLAIYLEVAASSVLIVRIFLEGFSQK